MGANVAQDNGSKYANDGTRVLERSRHGENARPKWRLQEIREWSHVPETVKSLLEYWE